MKIHLLGTGEAVPNARRKNTCLFIEQGASNLLIDGHNEVSVSLAAKGIDYAHIQNIFLTHHHLDHLHGIASLLEHVYVSNFLRGPQQNHRTYPVNIYGNAETLEKARKLLDLYGHIEGKRVSFPRIFHELPMARHDFKIGDMDVTSLPMNHGDMPVLSVSIKAQNGKKMLYSADTEPHQPFFDLIEEGDIVFHECNGVEKKEVPIHTALHQLKQFWPYLKASHLYLVHLPDMTEEYESEVQKELDDNFNHRIHFCRDGQVVEFS